MIESVDRNKELLLVSDEITDSFIYSNTIFSTMNSKKCKNCRKDIPIKNTTFCSKYCEVKWRCCKSKDGKIFLDRKCKNCGKTIKRKNYPNVNYTQWNKTNFCSRKCDATHRHKVAFYGLAKKKSCKQCGKVMIWKDYHVGIWSNRKFCSIKCHGLYSFGRYMGTDKKVNLRNCIYCNKIIDYGIVQNNYHNRKFCSSRCHYLWRNNKDYVKLYGVEKANEIRAKQSASGGHPNSIAALRGSIQNHEWHTGKSYNEIYGKKRAKEIIEKKKRTFKERGIVPISKTYIGKNYEEIYGKKRGKEIREKQRLSSIGKVHPNSILAMKRHNSKIRGKTLEDFYGEKKAFNIKKRMYGKSSPLYIHGFGYYPYDKKFNLSLKRAILRRDKYLCSICRKRGKDCHHIHYDKFDSREETLVCLCRKHNAKVNFNRDYWFSYFSYKLNQEPEAVF